MMHLMFRRCELAGEYAVRPGYWFKARRYGFGAFPVTVQGWALTWTFAALLALAIWRMPTLATKREVGGALVIAFIAICWLKTDGGWKWRWGEKA